MLIISVKVGVGPLFENLPGKHVFAYSAVGMARNPYYTTFLKNKRNTHLPRVKVLSDSHLTGWG